MATKTIQNGDPNGDREVRWGREVLTTVLSGFAVMLTLIALLIGAVIYNAKEFAAAAEDRAVMRVHIERLEGEVKLLAAQIVIRIEKAKGDHDVIDRRLDRVEARAK
jgi:hypothetical protein